MVASLRFSLSALLLACSSTALAQPFSLPALPYAEDALEPHIDAATLRIHHGRHHQIYVNNLSAAVAQDPRLEGMTIEQILRGVSEYSMAIRNNGGGHYNHSLFWSLLAPAGDGGEPSPELLEAINAQFGSLDSFKREFENTALSVFGSGWAWLIRTDDGALAITSTPNQDNPLMDVASPNGEPLLAIDVWEHAYYLRYQNVRADYVRGWWPIVNWKEVNRRFAGG
ncbi:superoxide dismutase [Aquimonas voraii]|uniref:Superoxide dismutase n=1 Tax=Aquimonas voraii TaxID=265719 RepID=A0A1G6SSN0_9GAMM|nr:superoxide dismutase, Fe-Mn family [Aquimonas voraii]